MKVPVLEIFGPTFQGEGAVIGQKTMFVRTAGCDYSCSWCDSAFTWDGSQKDKIRMMDGDDILAALDSGQLAGAALDVFRCEPLPADHPFWPHPKITISPHIASVTQPRSAAREIVANIRRVEAGEAPHNTVNVAAGY